MTEYWFARYTPSSDVRRAGRGMIPLNWKGRAVMAAFLLCFALGGGLFMWFGLQDQFAIGIPLFVVMVIIGASAFLWASVARTDPAKSAWDYLKERGR